MKVDFYTTILYLHILSAILATGPLFVLLPIIGKLAKSPRELEGALLSLLKTIIRLVMHAGHVLVITGVLLIMLGLWPWHTSWVVMTVAVMLISIVFLARGFSRVLKDFDPAADKQLIIRKLKKTTWQYITLMLVMLWLMVQKPQFW